MPLAKIHVLQGRYNGRRLGNVSKAVQDALINILKIPPDDFFQIIHVPPRNRFPHTPSFVGMKYSTTSSRLKSRSFPAGRRKPASPCSWN
jgi:Tautomerase enzyme